MPTVEEQRTVLNLIKLTSNGLSVASFLEIKDVLAKKYKEIYGSDIDLTNTTADGIFLENMSLIISNILQAFKFLYSNTDIRTAQGTYLESLCALTGIYRKPASQSVAYLSITNNGDTAITLQGGASGNQLSFIDNSGLIWKTGIGDITHTSATFTVVLEPGVAQSIPVYCEIYGPVQAKKGWISQLVNNDIDILFEQIDDAIIGSNIESDSELRQRRNDSISSSGLSVISNLQGALLSIGGVQEVKIYNNNSENIIHSLDDTIVNIGSVYIIIKQNQIIDDEFIGNILYDKLTPGISTSIKSSGVIGGIEHSYNASSGGSILQNTVYWKEATPITNDTVVTMKAILYNNFNQDDFLNNIVNYLNGLKIGQTFTSFEIMSELTTSDINTHNAQTFVINEISVESDGPFEEIDMTTYYQYFTKDTYFNLSPENCVITTSTEGNITTLTLTWNN